MCCTFITTSECVSECFSLRVDRSLTKTNENKKELYQWMCCLLNVFHDRTGLIASIHTHLNVAVVRSFFFNILWFCRATYTRVCWMCVLYVFFSFFFFWRVVQFNKVLNVTVKVRSKLWPGWRDFSSLGGVFTTTICHLPNTRLHRPPLCVSKLKVFLNMSVLINAWSH